MPWQYEPQKAQLEHKAQICAKFQKRKHDSFCTMVRKRKCDAHPPACPPAGRTSFFPTNYNTRGQFLPHNTRGQFLPRVKNLFRMWHETIEKVYKFGVQTAWL